MGRTAASVPADLPPGAARGTTGEVRDRGSDRKCGREDGSVEPLGAELGGYVLGCLDDTALLELVDLAAVVEVFAHVTGCPEDAPEQVAQRIDRGRLHPVEFAENAQDGARLSPAVGDSTQ